MRSSVFLIYGLLLSLTAAAQQADLTAASRQDARSIYKSELKEIEKRANDFRKRQLKQKAYQAEVDANKKSYRDKKTKQRRDYELARKLYIKNKKSRKVIPLETYKPAHDAKERKYQKDYERWQKLFSKRKIQVKKAKQAGKNIIPEDKEVGLDYKEIQINRSRK